MGVDWYTCNRCGENFPDCGYCVWCECGQHWCSDECAEKDGLKHIYNEDGDDYDEAEDSCNFCRGEDAPDADLIVYLLSELGLTREEAVRRMNGRT